MLIVISPAKTLDFDTQPVTTQYSQPEMLNQSESLINILTTKSPADIESLIMLNKHY